MLLVLVAISALLVLALLLKPARFDHGGLHGRRKCSVQIVVLGDIGRSPRMQYHALSIARHGGEVQLIGYLDNEPLAELCNNDRVSIIGLPSTPRSLQTNNRILFLVYAPVKILLQIWNLWNVLMYTTKPTEWMLVQNPPAIPTLLIASLACWFRNTRLVIDWHNFGYSILSLKLGGNHPIVKVSKLYEMPFVGLANYNLTVTDAMARLLQKRIHNRKSIFTLHDRPADIFQPLTQQQRNSFLTQHPLTSPHFSKDTGSDNRNIRLLVTATSWTPDEDFSLLLNALQEYSSRATSSPPRLPDLVFIITGKGPLKKKYESKIADMTANGRLNRVTVKTAWLSFEDYALLLGSADLGVSLHTSSSGVDLPMKVLDMFGTGLPVAGWSKYEAWPELVQEGVNGKGFTGSDHLADILVDLFEPDSTQLDTLRRGAIEQSKRRWDEEWDSVAGRILGLTK